ncbi:carbon-nitrogen hydrolase family protein [Mesorhizobium sp. Root552]|uniref:carbon-nitrogen hydrolase family protein n=1 Tax=Mesorhizobium sp. Root552 TaxID=1736555 RepID=UPI000B2D43A4|nr:carbon-nitrogen hydrolase family protein [Mesorhizobium sp. Root552]
MRLAIYQMQAKAGDVGANLTSIEGSIRRAAAQGANLLVAPELALPGYGAGPAMAALAEAPDGASWRRLAAVSRETGVAILAGFAEKSGDTVYNSSLFVDGDEPPVVYRKSHLYGPYERGLFAAEKPSARIIEHAGIRFGMLICYDVEFPENVRRLAQAGAQAALVPTALPASDHADFIARRMIPVRAFENQLFVAYVNHCGADDRFAYAGLSGVAAPDGTLLAAAGNVVEELLIADLDPSAFRQAAEQNPYLADLRLG